MNVPISRSIPCADCKTKKKMMRFTQTCGATVCLYCRATHPNNCSTCLEAIKNRPEVKAKSKYGNGTSNY